MDFQKIEQVATRYFENTPVIKIWQTFILLKANGVTRMNAILAKNFMFGEFSKKLKIRKKKNHLCKYFENTSLTEKRSKSDHFLDKITSVSRKYMSYRRKFRRFLAYFDIFI